MTLTLLFSAMLLQAAEKQWLNFKGKNGPGKGKHIVLIAGDEEYRTEESCPMLAKILSVHHGFDTTVLFSLDKSGRYIDPQNQTSMPGLEALKKADLMIIGTRFRRLTDDQYQIIADYLNAGKPVIGFRTATHAFTGPGKTGDFKWGEFGLKILGERWISHHGRHKVEGTRSKVEAANAKHDILNGVGEIFGTSDVYGVNHVNPDNASILLRAIVTETLDPKSKAIDGPKNAPMMPLAWVREYTSPNGKNKGTAFCTTLGASEDYRDADLRRLVVNASFSLLGLPVPDKANVSYVDEFKTTFYANNRTSDYYLERKLKVSDFVMGKSAATGLNNGKKPAPKKAAPKQEQKKPAPKPKVKKARKGPAEDSDKIAYAQPKKAKGKAEPVRLPLVASKGQRIALVGNSLGERMLNYGYFETELQARFPELELYVRNLCNPGDTAGFRPHSSRTDQWAFPGAEKFHPDLQAHFGIGHFASPDEWLAELEADTILGFFGYNESFDGVEHVDRFKAELRAWIDHTQSLSYNGKAAPRIVLVTPTAFEDLTKRYDLPDGDEENTRLAVYARAVASVAAEKRVGLIDVFDLSKKWFKSKRTDFTINGCHLSDAGYKKLAPALADALFGKKKRNRKADVAALREAVLDKDWFWMNDYRMLNGVHVHGRRWKPYGNFNYPEEIEKMRQMTKLRDGRIWKIAAGVKNVPPVDDTKTRALTPVETNFKQPIQYLGREKALEKFTIREGYQIELFASETEFPDLRNPVQMSFDNKGRLWVSVLPSYPHYQPGGDKPHDKILIFEDTDGDGRADRQKVFADGLNLPIGFELAPEGVYLSEEPHLILLRDTDGDDRADTREILMTGFDTHDTHHAISAYSADPSGSFYMCEGRFLHTQVETPYGPQRMTDGGVWRFDPKNWRLERYSQSDYSNPWGIAFDEWEQCFISDASSGKNYMGLPVSAKLTHGLEIPKVEEFAPKRSRPTSGSEFVSSRHFAEDIQGHFMINNSIGFLGTSLHDVWEEGSGVFGKHIGDLVASTDPNYRPVDLEFAPDGSLYIVDWHNALIGHMQHSARDPNRDVDHGRIYRVTHKTRPLVKPAKVAGASLNELLENLKLPEYRTRYRTRREIRGHSAKKVLPAVRKWAASLDKKDPNYDRLLCEALWVTWAQNQVDENLLNQVLNSKRYEARAAGVHVLRYAYSKIPNSTELFMKAAQDPHLRVRLEAIVAASWLDNPDGVQIALEGLKKPFDRWMGPVFDIIMKSTLKDDVEVLKAANKLNITSNARAAEYFAGKLDFSVKNEENKSYGPTTKLNKEQTEIYKLGKQVFVRDGHCATCHQHNGEGLDNAYPPLTKSEWIEDNDRMIKIVLHGLWGAMEVNGKAFDPTKGVPPMPGFGGFTNDKEVAAVINYVRNSFGNKAEFVSPEDVAKVRAATKGRNNFYMVDELMKEHPVTGWEKWKKTTIDTSFE